MNATNTPQPQVKRGRTPMIVGIAVVCLLFVVWDLNTQRSTGGGGWGSIIPLGQCNRCNGKGWVDCNKCNGSGKVFVFFGDRNELVDCAHCDKFIRGRLKCSACGGSGWK